MAIYRAAPAVALAALLLTTQGCIETKNESGYNFRQKTLDNAELGGMSRREVYSALGSPSARSAVNQEKWYYIGSETARKSIFDPKMSKLHTLEISFNEDGVVQNWREYNEGDINRVGFSDDKTPTAGHSVGVLEQLVGNIGRFSNAEAPVEPD